MREIKFRAWDTKNKYMVDASWGNWISFDGVVYEEANIKYNTPHIEIEKVKDLIIMQFTGLKDKNGVDIYEGDILQNPEGKTGVIIFNEGSFALQIYKSDKEVKYIILNVGYVRNKEIIGNIYQNPELVTTPTRG